MLLGRQMRQWVAAAAEYIVIEKSLPGLSLFVRPRMTMLTSTEHHADLAPLTELINTGQLKPAIDATYPLDQAPDAMRQLEAGTVRGKISIAIPPTSSRSAATRTVARQNTRRV